VTASRKQHTPSRAKSKMVISMQDIAKAGVVNGSSYHQRKIQHFKALLLQPVTIRPTHFTLLVRGQATCTCLTLY
jgi:hypothetical protein